MLQTRKIRRSRSLPVIDDENVAEQEQRREMYENLQIRKETLETTLQAKLAELKKLCIQEAELTGKLPSETPLRPNEPEPHIRRRVKTEFALKDSLFNDSNHLKQQELEYEIQIKIVSASLKLLNEPQASKKIKKQRRRAYDDAVKKLNILKSRIPPSNKRLSILGERNFSPPSLRSTEMPRANDKPRPSTSVGIPYVKSGSATYLNDEPDTVPQTGLKRSEAQHSLRSGEKQRPSTSVGLPYSKSSSLLSEDFQMETTSIRYVRTQGPPILQVDSKPRPSTSVGLPYVKSSSSSVINDEQDIKSHKRFARPEAPSSLRNEEKRRPSPLVGLPSAESGSASSFLNDEPDIPQKRFARADALSLISLDDMKCDSHVDDSIADIKPKLQECNLARTNSLDNSRRKSYISAVNEPLASPHRSRHRLQKKVPTKNPPPPVPLMTQRPPLPVPTTPTQRAPPPVPTMSQRPLPPLPTSSFSDESVHEIRGNAGTPTPMTIANSPIPLSFSSSPTPMRIVSSPTLMMRPPSTPTPSRMVSSPTPSTMSIGQRISFWEDTLPTNEDPSPCVSSSSIATDAGRPVAIPISPTIVPSGASLDVVSVGHVIPYWEETKPFEMSDFYKYSAKHRSKQQQNASTQQGSLDV